MRSNKKLISTLSTVQFLPNSEYPLFGLRMPRIASKHRNTYKHTSSIFKFITGQFNG